jgi:hypothetical protein
MPAADELAPGPGTYASDVALKTTATLSGVECWVVDTTAKTDEGTEAAELWISKQTGLPVQAKVGGQIEKWTYQRFNQVRDSEFAVPADVEFLDPADLAARLRELERRPGDTND